MTDPKDYLAFADAIAALLHWNGGTVHLDIQQMSEDRGRKDTQDGITTFQYRVCCGVQGEASLHQQRGRPRKKVGFWDFTFGMDADDRRQRRPEEELLGNLNFGLRQRGLEGMLSRTESITVQEMVSAYTVQSIDGELVLLTPQGTEIALPTEIKERLTREAIQWYLENVQRQA